ncbi:response regulator receiver modulated diguanylate cyclase [Hungatella effluvii]|uniref:Stage 0 sporulation protein A homolog n=1 Tax=Hungatella effluvii TaxID=1096246 RepID=A0A2V3XYV6_9FIRM|nr:diguanylate cyclase [Hungatella effluvii]PXX49778.1 response regulator receiver modulated diguanylate cyclase [Hungatella effluvii]
MTGRQKILAVDDSLLICQQIEKVLKNEEYTVYKSHSAKETLELLEEVDPDLILLDVILPDMEGYELFEKIKEKDKNHAPVIFITSKDSEQDVIRGFELGACDYIKKPFRPEELKSRVKAHLEDKRERDELKILNETLKANMQILNRVAYRDELTGLYNRRFVVEKLAQDLMEPNRQDALVMIDVDDFKHVNDCYGHDAGDMVLVCIANIMESVCRRHKVVRWGGEEFLIILMAVTKQECYEVCEEIRKEIQAFPFLQGNTTFYCTVTLGISLYDKEQSFKMNMTHADMALYRGKKTGKNRTVWYGYEEESGV